MTTPDVKEMAVRCIWTGKEGIANPSFLADLQDGVYAVVGPIASHVADQQFQDELALVCIEQNFRNGSLTEPKYSKLKGQRLDRLSTQAQREQGRMDQTRPQIEALPVSASANAEFGK